MNSHDIIEGLKSQASEKYKTNAVKMGIPEECSIGVSTAIIRNLAKEIGKSNELAFELWDTGYHEAKLLAVLLFNPNDMTHSHLEKLMTEVISWDLCDHLCKNLLIKMKNYEDFIFKWVNSTHVYEKRASFTLIASSVVHDKKISTDMLDTYLRLIYGNSDTEHEHIKKAVSWALREVGKKDFNYNEKALLVAHDLLASGNKTQVWIAKDAMKELENVVKVEGRTRLISANTKMGKIPIDQ